MRTWAFFQGDEDCGRSRKIAEGFGLPFRDAIAVADVIVDRAVL